MSERTFEKEIRSLEKGEGEIFEGEGILAVTKAALQAGVSYVRGYQGSPVSHLVDVLSQAKDIRDRYGIHLEVTRERFGIDEDVCTGDHSCIRLSGCPSLTIKDNPDPLRKDPIDRALRHRLRRLRTVWRSRPCRHPLPVHFPRRNRLQPNAARALLGATASRRHPSGEHQGSRSPRAAIRG